MFMFAFNHYIILQQYFISNALSAILSSYTSSPLLAALFVSRLLSIVALTYFFRMSIVFQFSNHAHDIYTRTHSIVNVTFSIWISQIFNMYVECAIKKKRQSSKTSHQLYSWLYATLQRVKMWKVIAVQSA